MGTIRTIIGTVIVFAIGINVIAGIAGRDDSNAPGGNPLSNGDPKKTVVTAPAPQLSADERARILSNTIKGLKVKRDDMEKVTFYSTQSGDALKTQLNAYLGVPDDGRPYLRMRAVFFGDRWVFFESIKIMADNEIVLEKTLPRSVITRDNEAGSVWEVADYSPQQDDIQALEKISNAKSATIRFSGRDRIRDHKISSAERAALRSILKAHHELEQRL